MSLMDVFRKGGKFYPTKARCYNCGTVSEIRVPKGQTIDEYIASGEATCPNCKCATLKRIIIMGKVTVPSKASTLDNIKKEVRKIDKALSPKPIPRQRQPQYEEEAEYEEEPEIQYQNVKHPVRRNERVAPVEEESYDPEPPSFSPRPRDVDMWTGKERRK